MFSSSNASLKYEFQSLIIAHKARHHDAVPTCAPLNIWTLERDNIHGLCRCDVYTGIPRIRCVTWTNGSQTRQICRIYIPGEGYFRETYKTQSIKPISHTTQGCVQGQSVCFYVSLYFFPLNLICNMTTFRYLVPFNPAHRLRVCLRSEYVLALCLILHSL